MINRYVWALTVIMVASAMGGLVVSNNAWALEGKSIRWCTDSSGKVYRCDAGVEKKSSDNRCHMSYRPEIVRAALLRRYHGGPYEAALFGEIEAAGGVKYLYLLEVAKSDYPCLYVTSEVNTLSPPGRGPYFLGVFTEEGHGNYGLSGDWGNIDLFEAKALKLVRQYLEMDLTRIKTSSSREGK